MSAMKTPDWIIEGYDSKEEYEKSRGISKKKIKGKTFKIRKCPKCSSTDVGVVLIGEENKKANNWECKKCKWKGRDIKIEEVGEDEFLKSMEEK